MGSEGENRGGEGEIAPHEARNAAEFVALMRALKDRSGLTYRQLEERAAERGEVLPRSTLAGALSGRSLPRAPLLGAFVRACGEGERAAEWLRARDRIAALGPAPHEDPVPHQGPAPHEDPARNGSPAQDGTAAGPAQDGGPAPAVRTRPAPLLFGSLAVTAVAAAAVWALTSSGPPSDPTGPAAHEGASASPDDGPVLPDGWVRIRPAVSDLCLTDGTVRDKRYGSLVAVQRPCDEVAPQRTTLGGPLKDGTYRIEWHHPEHGKGCLKLLTDGAARGCWSPGTTAGSPAASASSPLRARRTGARAGTGATPGTRCAFRATDAWESRARTPPRAPLPWCGGARAT